MAVIKNPFEQWVDPTIGGRVIYNANIYVGQPDTDPTIPENRLQVYYIDENQQRIDLAQPITTNTGGFTVISETNPKIIKIQVDEDNYSITVKDRNLVDKWVIENVQGESPVIKIEHNDTLNRNAEGAHNSIAILNETGENLQDFVDLSYLSDVAEMKSLPDAIKLTIDNKDIPASTISYYNGWAAQNKPVGGAKYTLTTRQRVRDTISDQTWEPDGFGDHYLFGGSEYVAIIQNEGFTSVDQYGAKPNDPSFDCTDVFYAASVAARALAGGVNLGNNNINPRSYVSFTPGCVYYQYKTVALDVEAVRIDFKSEGVAVISGANPATPETRNTLGWSFNQIYRTTFAGLSFAGFDKIHEWDTNNTDNATVVYDDCDFMDSGVSGTPVIDTRSFAESRSTDLVFNNCRCQFVPMLLDSYCDTLRFEGGRYKNYDADGCLIQADSLVTTEGGMFVPAVRGDNARFFDLYDNGTTGTRGFNSNGTRFSPEGGGISVIYNFMNGQDAATNHLTNFIMFYGGANSASSGTLDGALVVLQDDDVNSIAPSMIGFYGASVRSNSGLVRTANNLPVGKTRGRFAIEVSEACQSHLTDINTPVSFPLVEDILRPYLVGNELYNEPTTITNTGNYSIDLVAVNSGPNAIIQFQNSGVTVEAISNAFDGQTVTIEFVGNSNSVVDFSNGSRLFLAGGANFTGNAFSTITLKWHRAGDKWYEVGRCSR